MFAMSLRVGDMILPSVCAELFYAACETYGAKFVCSVCGHEEEWKGRKYETMRCSRPDMRCSGVMVLIINEQGGEKMG